MEVASIVKTSNKCGGEASAPPILNYHIGERHRTAKQQSRELGPYEKVEGLKYEIIIKIKLNKIFQKFWSKFCSIYLIIVLT